ncbi:hypothetical protein IVB34_44635 [Bradyrhizobium sp. 2]|uniref:hypothetical protein n=1 Tax=Bradyrhizobium sp. 2 TaxID=190045 RepID=UPI001FF85F22|nr:hypothetical protein [Bradyrhizobium sp. 2]MCK1465262.1 hypothetical protein [Bradyrhizobium sp. 2]
MTAETDPRARAGTYIAPQGLYEQNKALPFLGRVSCRRKQLVAGEWTELELVYEVGAVGLADGAWLKLAFKFYSDWALFQTSDPTGANYVSAEYHAGPLRPGQSPSTVQGLKVRFDQKGHERPFQKAIIIDVVDGYLNPGDRIVIRLGDRRQGGGGTRAQSFVEKNFRFRMFIDPLGSSKFAEVPGDCILDIVPGAPLVSALVMPRLVAPLLPFDVVVRLEDVWGNVCRDQAPRGELHLTDPAGGVQSQPLEFSLDGWSVARVRNVRLEREGEWRFEVLVEGIATPAVGFAQVEPLTQALRPLYADLHVHSHDTVGTNDTFYNLAYGRDVAALDVLGYTVNDFNIKQADWERAVEIIAGLNEPGRFVCYPGTEWCGNSSAGGDRNVVFLGEGKPRFPFDAEGRSVRSFEWNELTAEAIRPGVWPADELYAAYADDPENHLLIPHVGGRRCILDWHHPELERLVEVGSSWGQFHWFYTDALSRGYRVGASAAGDEHQGRCGGGAPATAVFGSRGGLTGVLADSLDCASVGRALRARRTFATTGERSFASLSFGASWMGEVVSAKLSEPLTYRLLGDQGWEQVQLFDAERVIWSRDLNAEVGLSERKLRVRLAGARIKDRYRAANWVGEITVTGAAILDVRGIGFDHPEQRAWREDATTVGFTTATHGDTDAIELTLSSLAGVEIEVRGAITGYVKVGDALQPPPHVHAPQFSLKATGADLLERRCTRALSGIELEVTIERVTEGALPRDVGGEIDLSPLGLAKGVEHPLFITARQRDQSRIWTSPVFLTPVG